MSETTAYRTPAGVLFTPRVTGAYAGPHASNGRPAMRLSEQDDTAFRSLGHEGTVTVTDRVTDTRWVVRRTACGAACRCDAEATPAGAA